MMYFKVIILLVSALAINGADMDCSKIPGDGKVDLDDCCKLPLMFDHDVVHNCEELYDENSAENDDEEGPPSGSCAVQCVFNDTKLTTNGDIDVDLTTTFLKNAITAHTEWVTIVEEGISICFDLVGKMEDDIKKMMEVDAAKATYQFCNPKAGIFGSCLYSHMMKECPEDLFVKSNVCKSMKKYVNTCILPSS